MARKSESRAEKGEAGGAEGELSQVDLVKMSLHDLGPDAKPQAIQDHIRAKYNREVAKGIISNYKSVLKRKGLVAGNGGGRGRRGGGPGGIRLEDLETVRGLLDRLGADGVRRLVDVLA